VLDFVSVDKIHWYALERREKKKEIKRYCVMYIGQKKNFWVVDVGHFVPGSREQGIGSSEGFVKVHVDDLREHVEKL
jgi:hypothetical protein